MRGRKIAISLYSYSILLYLLREYCFTYLNSVGENGWEERSKTRCSSHVSGRTSGLRQIILRCAKYSANVATPFVASFSKASALALASWLIAAEAEMSIAMMAREHRDILDIFFSVVIETRQETMLGAPRWLLDLYHQ
jgi:hypothetical protein